MIRTHVLRASIQRELADSLNQESGRIYSAVLVEHWRIYRRQGVWLRSGQAEKLNDCYTDTPALLHAHSIDAAQQGFYRACKTARQLRRNGDGVTRYPWRRKRYRSTIWKKTGIRVQDGQMRLALARGKQPVRVNLPSSWSAVEIREVRLVFNHKRRGYDWHLVVEDGTQPPDRSDWDNVAAIDLGEIHPAVVSDPTQAVVVSARELRATIQYRNKKLATLSRLQSRCQKGSRRWQRLQRRRNKVRGHCSCKIGDIEHKVSRAVITWAESRQVGKLVIGDVRDIGDGKRLHRKSQQKVSQWTHGKLRQYLTYKAEAAGIAVVLQAEHYTSQTCPACRQRYKPRGRTYRCPQPDCDFVGHRDVVGSSGILSLYLNGEIGGIFPEDIQVVQPFKIVRKAEVSRSRPGSRLDTAQVACGA